jgi:hypothetical protein
MFAIALLPLVCYFLFLTNLHFRRTPTVLNGSLDFTLLAWGLFGLLTLGPGRLVIPLYVFAAWGMYTWIFWFGFYFVAVHIFALLFNNRFVIYHAKRELVLPAFFTLARELDPKTEWAGNVLSFHGLGVQWAVSHDRFGGHLLFVPTNPMQENPHREILRKHLTELCQTITVPKSRIRWFWGLLTFGLGCVVIGMLAKDFPLLLQQFSDYWLAKGM